MGCPYFFRIISNEVFDKKFNEKNEEKTKEAFDEQGYLKTGDMGSLRPSPDGKVNLLTITGRIKELVITAGGENVAPVPIEDNFKE